MTHSADLTDRGQREASMGNTTSCQLQLKSQARRPTITGYMVATVSPITNGKSTHIAALSQQFALSYSLPGVYQV